MLAIIIPYFKINDFKETLQSIEKQTDKRFILYIGNDKSPNNPKNTIEETLKNIDYQYFEYQNNLGSENIALQWERVINEISDEEKWIMILGDDDVLGENVVEEFYKNLPILEEKDISLVKYSQCSINDKGEQQRDFTVLPQIYSSKKFFEDKFFGKMHSSLSEHIFRKDIFEKYLFKKFPLAWHSDDLAILEFSNLKDFLFINKAKVFVRITEHSISGKDNNTIDKQYASYLFYCYVLENYISDFPKSFIHLIIKRYRENIWRTGFPINLDITKIYLSKKDYWHAFLSIRMNQQLKKRILEIHKNA